MGRVSWFYGLVAKLVNASDLDVKTYIFYGTHIIIVRYTCITKTKNYEQEKKWTDQQFIEAVKKQVYLMQM